jgi:hypothetical protein
LLPEALLRQRQLRVIGQRVPGCTEVRRCDNIEQRRSHVLPGPIHLSMFTIH